MIVRFILAALILSTSTLIHTGCASRPSTGPDSDFHAEANWIYDAQGDFSFALLDGWRMLGQPGDELYMLMRDPEDESGTNVIFQSEEFAGEVKEYVALFLNVVARDYGGYHELAREPFATDYGLTGLRLVIRDNDDSNSVRQVHFFVKSGSRILMVSGSELDAMPIKSDQDFFKIAKTLRAGR